jgi:hypothetical protein
MKKFPLRKEGKLKEGINMFLFDLNLCMKLKINYEDFQRKFYYKFKEYKPPLKPYLLLQKMLIKNFVEKDP